MSHKSSISGMGEPVSAIRVMNKKLLLSIMVGINIMLSCGKEYVKLAWEFICKPGRVISCLDMYCTNVLMYCTMVLLARLTKGQTLDV